MNDVSDPDVGEPDGVRLGVRDLFADLFGYEEVEFLELFLRFVLLHQ